MSLVCKECGSDRMIPSVRILDQGEASGGSLLVMICGEPNALLFKDRLYGQLQAEICGECGHTKLRVANPKELYKKYQESLTNG